MRPWPWLPLVALALGACDDGLGSRPVLRTHAEQILFTGAYRFVPVPYPDSGTAVLDLAHDRFSMRLMGGGAWAIGDSGSLGPQTPWHADSVAYWSPKDLGSVAQIYIAPDETVLMLLPAAGQVSEVVFGP
ncbi:MAG TPA: hypothetical protein VK733_13160 [Gemmatimonadaceae bacterium]|jgi:hypothetical protein|nr:hypothetical protein [Gemmatimonadaceae bacterium]